MSNKITILSTSPRNHGNSDLLCDEILRGAKENGAQIEKIRTDLLNIDKCSACGACRQDKPFGRCIKNDDFMMLFDKMQNSDIVVFATPVYFYDVSAQLKIIFDRSYCSYKNITFKHAAFIATMTSTDMDKMCHVVESFELYLHCLKNVDNVGVITVGGVREVGAVMDKEAFREAYELGKRLALLP